MPQRNTDYNYVNSLMEPYLPLCGLDLEEWLKNNKNICLSNSKDDLALFEFESDSVYSGHYFFKSKGKDAVQSATSFLDHFFKNYEPRIIKGTTPLETLGARWLSRKLGFKSYGVVQTVVGPCELFILTKEDWENRINE